MSLDADHLIDRRRLKRRLTVWRLVAIVAVVAAVIAAVGRIGALEEEAYVARLDVNGLIVDEPERDAALAAVAEDDLARALVVRISSPGGTVVGGESLYRSLRAVAADKPVVAVMGEMATSAGYMTALGADHIVARSSTITGSIGVIMQTMDLTGLLANIGVKPEAIKSRPLKAQPNPLEPLTPEGRAASRSLVLDAYEMFVDMVAERRNLPRDAAAAAADGRVFTGRQALAERLVDAIGGEPEARRWLAETHGIEPDLPVHDVEVADDDDLFVELVQTVTGKALFSERLRLDGLISLWHPGW